MAILASIVSPAAKTVPTRGSRWMPWICVEWMDGQREGRMDGWIDGWMDGGIDRCGLAQDTDWTGRLCWYTVVIG